MRLSHGAIPLIIMALAAGAPCRSPGAQTPPASGPTAGGFSAAFMAKMLTLIALKGSDHEMAALFAATLGLTGPGTTWGNHQIAAKEDGDEALHIFEISRGSDEDVALAYGKGDLVMGYRARRDGVLVSAFRFNRQAQQITPLTPVEAEASFSAERKFWIDNVDHLIAEKK